MSNGRFDGLEADPKNGFSVAFAGRGDGSVVEEMGSMLNA